MRDDWETYAAIGMPLIVGTFAGALVGWWGLVGAVLTTVLAIWLGPKRGNKPPRLKVGDLVYAPGQRWYIVHWRTEDDKVYLGIEPEMALDWVTPDEIQDPYA